MLRSLMLVVVSCLLWSCHRKPQAVVEPEQEDPVEARKKRLADNLRHLMSLTREADSAVDAGCREKFASLLEQRSKVGKERDQLVSELAGDDRKKRNDLFAEIASRNSDLKARLEETAARGRCTNLIASLAAATEEYFSDQGEYPRI